MTQLTVKEIWRYPVKSMQGERLDEVTLTKKGLPYDRGWALRDEEKQTIRGAKYMGELLLCEARYLEGTSAGLVPHVAITLPDGRTVNSDDPGVHGLLSEVVGRRVTLWPLQPAQNEEHYLIRGLDQESAEAEARMLFGLLPGEPLPDLSKAPRHILAELRRYATPRGTYFDAFPLNVLTDASLRFLAQKLPGSLLDVRRFRPNILVADASGAAVLREREWVGHTLRIGEAIIQAVMECPRCIVTTRAQSGLPHDPTILRTIAREARHNLSIYADILEEGRLRIGDPVEVC